MTAILKDIRDLDARLKRGELTAEQHTHARATILHSVEIAETEFDPAPKRPAPGKTPIPKDTGTSAAFGFSLFICLAVMGSSMVFILLVLPDLNLALTVGVTLLAALTVALFRALDD